MLLIRCDEYGKVSNIIFSALTAEAFINYYAIYKGMSLKTVKKFTTKSYITEELDHDEMQQQYQKPYDERTTVKKWIESKQGGVVISDTVVKWIEIPCQYTRKYIPSGLDGSLIYQLNELFYLRNRLVHHKAKVLNIDLNDPDFTSMEDNNYVCLKEAENSVKVIIKSVKALKQIDNNIDISWLIG